MVICDVDHPDVEEFINWKVIEEQKVASLVAGSKAHELRLNDIFAAIRQWDGSAEDSVDPAKNPALKTAIKSAKKAMIPDTYTNCILQYAKQGFTSIEFPTYDVDWDPGGLHHRIGPEFEQLGARHRCVPAGGSG